MEIPNSPYYVNIGTSKSCLFIGMSRQLQSALKRNPVLYYAVEEAMLSASQGWYSVGILVFSQILNLMNCPAPDVRHEVAHEILKKRPSLEDFEKVLGALKTAAAEQGYKEADKAENRKAYYDQMIADWKEWVAGLEQRP